MSNLSVDGGNRSRLGAPVPPSRKVRQGDIYDKSTLDRIRSPTSCTAFGLSSFSLIACWGHAPTHRPQILQYSLMTARPFTTLIASMKHFVSHTPQPMHSMRVSCRGG